MILPKVVRNYFVWFVIGIFTSSLSMPVFAKDIDEILEQAETVGTARLSVLFWDIYDASLIANNGVFAKDKPFALSLTYLRDFDGKEIANRSIDEMRKLGMNDEMKLASWYQAMLDIFPNVKEGETITGAVDSNLISHFFFNNQYIGKVHDKDFSQWFFNIWLSEQTSEPEMRQQLLGIEK